MQHLPRTVLTALLVCLAVSLARGACAPGDRPIDGSCIAPGDKGKSGSIFIRETPAEFADGYGAPVSGRPAARLISNALLAEAPRPGLDMFETVLIPFEDLLEGPNPDGKLNQFSVAFGQALIHDLTKARQTLDFSLIGHPDFTFQNSDPLCQVIGEINSTSLYYFPCSATVTQNPDATRTIDLTTAERITLVVGTSWSYFNGPFSFTGPNAKVVKRSGNFPLGNAFTPDDTNSTRVPINDVTSFLDLSIIYASSQSVHNLLRANDGTGKLRIAPDGDLPFGGPGVPNDCGAFDAVTQPVSGSGDARVDENLYLTFVHTLYFRAHNLFATYVASHYPGLDDQQIFDRARRMNIALFQRQVYDEYLPEVFGKSNVRRALGNYEGYDSAVDPRVSVEYDIAFRVAHAQVLLPPTVFDGDCDPVTIEGTLGFPSHSRPNCLFTAFRNVGGVAVGKSALTQAAQKISGKLSDLLRNIVFRSANGQNTAGFNLDIEMFNVVRSRTFGVANFDALREFYRGESLYDLPNCSPGTPQDPLQCFKHITNNDTLAAALRDVYDKVDRIDAFVGMLLERDNPSQRFGPTVTQAILGQMRRTRDADPFFYLNSGALGFTAEEEAMTEWTLAETIEQTFDFPVWGNALRTPHGAHQFCSF